MSSSFRYIIDPDHRATSHSSQTTSYHRLVNGVGRLRSRDLDHSRRPKTGLRRADWFGCDLTIRQQSNAINVVHYSVSEPFLHQFRPRSMTKPLCLTALANGVGFANSPRLDHSKSQPEERISLQNGFRWSRKRPTQKVED